MSLVTRLINQRKRKRDWLAAYPFIYYDKMRDSAFCHVCIQAYHRSCISDNNIEPRSISEGYINWKDATCEGRGFQGHKLLKGHKEAINCTLFLPTCRENVGETFSSKHAVKESVNCQALLKILSKVRFLTRQALPFQGDKAGEINSNFNQMYYLPAEHNPFLNNWIITHPETVRTKWWRLWRSNCNRNSHYHNRRGGHQRCKHFTAYFVYTLGGQKPRLSGEFHLTLFTWRC